MPLVGYGIVFSAWCAMECLSMADAFCVGDYLGRAMFNTLIPRYPGAYFWPCLKLY